MAVGNFLSFVVLLRALFRTRQYEYVYTTEHRKIHLIAERLSLKVKNKTIKTEKLRGNPTDSIEGTVLQVNHKQYNNRKDGL